MYCMLRSQSTACYNCICFYPICSCRYSFTCICLCVVCHFLHFHVYCIRRVLGRKTKSPPVKVVPPTDTPITKITPTDTPISKTVSSVQPDEDDACLLCDKPIDVCIKPCGHTVLCRSHANTAKRCPQCRVCQQLSLYIHCVGVTVLLSWLLQGPIHCVDDLDPLCGMCQERRCTVTLKPCGHMMCEGLLLVLSCTCVDMYMCVSVHVCTCVYLYMHVFVSYHDA